MINEAARQSGYTLAQVLGDLPAPAASLGNDAGHFVLVFALVLATLFALWAALDAGRSARGDGTGRRRLSERHRGDFPEALDLMRRGLRDGRNPPDAMLVVAYDMPGPLGAEFASIAEAAHRGRPLDLVLRGAARRHDAPEFGMLGVAVDLARQRDGDLGALLDVLARRLRQARDVRMRARWLGVRARRASIIMACCPLVLAGLLFTGDPAALVALLTTISGLLCLAVAGLMIVAGFLALRRAGHLMP